jgi:tetratricopeptide (TPR) repeat protein
MESVSDVSGGGRSADVSSVAASEDASDRSASASELIPNEDSEDTVNIDASEARRRLNEKRGNRGGAAPMIAGGRAGGVAAIPSGFSQVSPNADPSNTRPPRVSDENRRKARKLFEEAQKEAADGKMGAARMNAKLASIYDPDKDEYRMQLEAWERPATAMKPQQPATSPSGQDESQAEIKALYDEAQSFEDAGDIDEALDVLERGIERFPSAAAFHNRMGVILALRKRDYEGAVHAIQRAIDIDPENLHYKSNLGKIVAKLRGRE